MGQWSCVFSAIQKGGEERERKEKERTERGRYLKPVVGAPTELTKTRAGGGAAWFRIEEATESSSHAMANFQFRFGAAAATSY